MIENIEREKEQLKRTSDSNIYKVGEQVSTYGKFGLRIFEVNNQGFFENISSVNENKVIEISFIKDDTKIIDYTDKFDIKIEQQTEIIPCRIVSISDNEDVIIDMYPKDGNKIPKKLKRYYVLILKKLDLFYVGAEFSLLYDKLSNGMKVRIEPYNNKNIKAESWYQQLFSE